MWVTGGKAHIKDLEAGDVQDPDEGGALALGLVQSLVDAQHQPAEHALVGGLGQGLDGKVGLHHAKTVGEGSGGEACQTPALPEALLPSHFTSGAHSREDRPQGGKQTQGSHTTLIPTDVYNDRKLKRQKDPTTQAQAKEEWQTHL